MTKSVYKNGISKNKKQYRRKRGLKLIRNVLIKRLTYNLGLRGGTLGSGTYLGVFKTIGYFRVGVVQA